MIPGIILARQAHSWLVAENDILSVRRGELEKGSEQVDKLCSLEGGGLGEGAEDRDVLRAGGAAGSKAAFAEDDTRAQGAFGVSGDGRAAVFDEGEKLRVFAGVCSDNQS